MPILKTDIVTELASIGRDEWNALLPDSNPFLRYEFLAALESENCLGEHVGWSPNHFIARNTEGTLVGAMPAYLKTNSFGEFVFDWSWASAYERAGLPYYPKLVCAIPFTPATGPRFLIAKNEDKSAITGTLIDSAVNYLHEKQLSSGHWLFPVSADLEILKARDMLPRLGYQYHWHNRDYADFEHYLSFFRSRKRKQVRYERRDVVTAGITTRILHGDELDDDLWETIYRFYKDTFLKKGNYPALTLAFFKTLSQSMGRNIVVVLAEYRGEFIAGSICFRGSDTLYGRYWGCTQEFRSLHFEVCFYRGIEYCIQEKLQCFEPGAQGEHKIARGFLPTETWSAHWIADPRFRAAIADFLDRETTALIDYRRQLDEMSPFHNGDKT